MGNSLNSFVGVSFPRSGHHLVQRILSAYFGGAFGYCEFYKPEDCCKTVPCSRLGQINLSKSHDFHSEMPILSDHNYLIQYRAFLPAVVSSYELYCANKGRDNIILFTLFAIRQRSRYIHFMDKWATASADDSSFIKISYERLTQSPVEVMKYIIEKFQKNPDVDTAKIVDIVASISKISVEKGQTVVSDASGVAKIRDIKEFRYYNKFLFAFLSQKTNKLFYQMEKNSELK